MTSEPHRTERIGWLRAAVLGANDGIISTSSLMVGVAAASSGPRDIVVAGVAGLAAGALSMAAGEYVSVSSQADTERAELDREREELATDPASELQELTAIYIGRGLRPELASEVAQGFKPFIDAGVIVDEQIRCPARGELKPLGGQLLLDGTLEVVIEEWIVIEPGIAGRQVIGRTPVAGQEFSKVDVALDVRADVPFTFRMTCRLSEP